MYIQFVYNPSITLLFEVQSYNIFLHILHYCLKFPLFCVKTFISCVKEVKKKIVFIYFFIIQKRNAIYQNF
jgi:hypothetical protein